MPINKNLTINIKSSLNEVEVEDLKTAWNQLAKEINLPSDKEAACFRKFTRKYGEKHRAYHNFSHLYSMFDLLKNDTKLKKQDLIKIRLCIWFHDLIYTIGNKKNELHSAEKARDFLKPYISEKMLESVYQIIISTAKHFPLENNYCNHLLLDIDLGVLASDSETYQQYTKAIRREYRMYPDFLYKPARKNILTKFVEREYIYFTDTYKTNYEAQARENLNQEIAELSK